MKRLFCIVILAFSAAISSCNAESKSDIKVESLKASPGSMELLVGERGSVKVTILPARAVQPTLTFSSNNKSVATVDFAGSVKAVAPGKAIITATCQDKKAEVTVTVKEKSKSGEVIKKITLNGSECSFADYAEYGIYIPDTEKINAILVLQHGCGMEQFGITRNHDLQYQAFAKKWGLMVIETALHGDCGVWHHPESGSAKALFNVISKQATDENHPELSSAPLLIFGHSSGGHWTLAMLRDYPERILAAVCYSAAWNPQWSYKAEVGNIPVLLRHAGAVDCPEASCELTAKNQFAKMRALDAPASIAYNEGEGHNYSRMRHMSIPFFEAALKQRLPLESGGKMRNIDRSKCWLGDSATKEVFAAKDYSGDKSGLCLLPDEEVALKWKEYVRTNDVADVTAPPAPYSLETDKLSDSIIRLRWKADADVESGIKQFIVSVDGKTVKTLPSDGSVYQSFDTNGDNTYPVSPAEMEVTLSGLKTGAVLAVQTVNQFGLVGEKAEIKLQ